MNGHRVLRHSLPSERVVKGVALLCRLDDELAKRVQRVAQRLGDRRTVVVELRRLGRDRVDARDCSRIAHAEAVEEGAADTVSGFGSVRQVTGNL